MNRQFFISITFLLTQSIFVISQNPYLISKKLEKNNLIKNGEIKESINKDTSFLLNRIVLFEEILKHSFDRYDEYARTVKDIVEIKAKKARGEKLYENEQKKLLAEKPISLKDTCIWLNQFLYKEKVISQNVKKEIEKYLHQGVDNPADIINAMYYLSGKEFLNSPKNLIFLIEQFAKNQLFNDSTKNNLIQQVKENPKFEYTQIYQAYPFFKPIKVHTIKSKQALGTYLGDLINSTLETNKIVDYQIIVKQDSIYDFIYDEVKDTSIWGFYEAINYHFFSFKFKNENYKYPISIGENEDSTLQVKQLLKGDFLNTILLQVTADDKLPYHPIVFNLAEDITHILYGSEESRLDRIIPQAQLEQFAVWKLNKKAPQNFYIWFPDGRTIRPKSLENIDYIVSTANKLKTIKEAETLGFFERLKSNEIEDFKANVMQILVDGEYNVISEIPKMIFTADASNCFDFSFTSDKEINFKKQYFQFATKIIYTYLDSSIILKKITINDGKEKNYKTITFETNKQNYSFQNHNTDNDCEAVFPALIEICEKENTKYKVYVNKGLKRVIFFVTDRQAAYLNKKYKLDLVKKY
jgi:hypothetical protein